MNPPSFPHIDSSMLDSIRCPRLDSFGFLIMPVLCQLFLPQPWFPPHILPPSLSPLPLTNAPSTPRWWPMYVPVEKTSRKLCCLKVNPKRFGECEFTIEEKKSFGMRMVPTEFLGPLMDHVECCSFVRRVTHVVRLGFQTLASIPIPDSPTLFQYTICPMYNVYIHKWQNISRPDW